MVRKDTYHLRDDRDIGTERVEVDGIRRDAVVVDLALREDQAE